MTPSAKTILVVIRHSPYGSNVAREALDAVLTAAAFEQPLSLLFMDDGVLQLLQGQDTQALGVKSLAATLAVLPMYDVDQLFVEQLSLDQRSLSGDDLFLPAKPLTTKAVQTLFDQHDTVLSF